MKNVLTTAAVLFLASAAIAAAAPAPKPAPTKMSQFNAWGSYSFGAAGSKLCYILSTPTAMEPASVDHGDIFFLVSRKAGGADYEAQAVMGYQMKDGSKVTVDVDGKTYTLFTRGESAWMENPEEEPQLVAALRKGKAMKVDAVSKRGTGTHYTYSLSGVTAALQSISTCK